MNKKELYEKRAELYKAFSDLQSQTEGRSMTAEESASWDKIKNDFTSIQEEIDNVEKRDRFADEIRRKMESRREEKGTKEDRQMDIFRRYLLDPASLDVEERSSITGVDGSATLPTAVADSIEAALLASGGMFEAAEVIRTTTGNNLVLPSVNDTSVKAEIVAQYGQSAKDAFSFSTATLGAFTYRTKIIPVSYELMQDTSYDLVGFIQDLMVEQLNRGMNDHFTNGKAAATNTPKGIVAAANAVNAAATAANPAVAADDLLNLIKGVNSAYWAKGKFMFNASTLVEIMKLKDQQGRFIWNPDMAGSAKGTIFGHEYIINPDMDDIAAGKAPVLFGDLSKYKIRLVRGMNFQRLNEALAEWLSIGMIGYCRADGLLLDAGTHPVAKLALAGGSGSGSGVGKA